MYFGFEWLLFMIPLVSYDVILVYRLFTGKIQMRCK